MDQISKARELILQMMPQLLEFRADLHQHPEPAWEEFRTTEKIASICSANGYKNFSFPLQTGLFFDLKSNAKLETIGIRADIDALPIQDEKNVFYHSKEAGYAHACGHDVHTAVVCGLAIVLKKLKVKLPVNLRFIFQPAEEPIPSGAPSMIKKGVLDNLSALLGFHVEPNLPISSVSITRGWVNAQSIRLEWTFSGKGGHSARPHLAQDALLASTDLMHSLLQLASRKWATPDDPVLLSFTKLNAGEGYNSIAKEAALTATLRLTNVEYADVILEEIAQISANIAGQWQVKTDFSCFKGAPPVINQGEPIEKIKNSYYRNLNDSLILVDDFRSMGGDDFGWYGQQIPTAFLRFGINDGKHTAGLHSGLFDVPEEAIRVAIEFFVVLILNWDK